MEYYIRNIDEYSEDSRQGNEFAPAWPFRLVVSESSDSGKTTMIMNLLMGNKGIKEDGDRYILCNDVVLIGKHLNEPKWQIVRDFFEELADQRNRKEDSETDSETDVSFQAFLPENMPDLKDFYPSRSTV